MCAIYIYFFSRVQKAMINVDKTLVSYQCYTFLVRQSSCSGEQSGTLSASVTSSERPRTLRGGSASRDRRGERHYIASWLLGKRECLET